MKKHLYEFLNNIIPTYAIDNVPEEVSPSSPYLTYTPVFGDILDGNIPISADLYYKTKSEKEMNKLVYKIGQEIGYGGIMVGNVWIKRGSPFCITIPETEDERQQDIKRRHLNLTIQIIGD